MRAVTTSLHKVEYSLIGSFLNRGLTATAREVMTWLEPEMFSAFKLGAIYSNIRKQARKDNLIDIIFLNQDFGEDLGMLAEISKNTYSSANLVGYARKVRSSWVNRCAQKTLLDVANKLTNAKESEIESITEEGLISLQKLLISKSEIKPVILGELLEGYVDVLEKRQKNNFDERLLHTGIGAVDDILGGVNPTDILVVAGRPGMGKTEFGLTITKNIASHKGSVMFFSLEMDNYQLIDRILSAGGKVGVKKLRNPNDMSDEDYARVGEYLNQIREHKIYFVDRGGLSADDIIAITENHVGTHGDLSAIVIDYLGLMTHGNDNKMNETQAISNTLMKLKTFAKNSRIPVILLSQLNREVDGRANKRPLNSDLRQSGSIEQDASQIIMLYREKAYKSDSGNDYSEAIITKNRFGELGTAYMQFDKGHFVDCDQAMAYQKATEHQGINRSSYSKVYGKVA